MEQLQARIFPNKKTLMQYNLKWNIRCFRIDGDGEGKRMVR